MIIGYVFIGALTGVLAAGLGMILMDFSFVWAALTYTIVGSLGFLAAAGICVLRTNYPLETPRPSPDELDGALSRL
jgi:hypothetical protein